LCFVIPLEEKEKVKLHFLFLASKYKVVNLYVAYRIAGNTPGKPNGGPAEFDGPNRYRHSEKQKCQKVKGDIQMSIPNTFIVRVKGFKVIIYQTLHLLF